MTRPVERIFHPYLDEGEWAEQDERTADRLVVASVIIASVMLVGGVAFWLSGYVL